MNISECFDFLNFWINKSTGAYYTVAELTQIVDRGQMSLYEDIQSKYATSQRVKDALIVFKDRYNFTPSQSISGYIVVPSDRNYLNLLDIQVEVPISGRTLYAPIKMVNEDERSFALNSQINPVTQSNPIGEQTAPRYFRIYPAGSGYTGTVSFLRRPLAPVFGYSVISGRVIVYDAATSTQLEWSENWINAVLVKALSSIGINLSDEMIANYAELKTKENYQSINML